MTITAHRVPTLGGIVAASWTPVEGVLLVADDAPPRQRHEDEDGEFFTWHCRDGEASRREFADPDECDLDGAAHVDTDHRAAPAPLWSCRVTRPGPPRRGVRAADTGRPAAGQRRRHVVTAYRPARSFGDVQRALLSEGWAADLVVDAMVLAVPAVVAYDWTDEDVAAAREQLQAWTGQDAVTRQDTAPDGGQDTGQGGPPRHGMTGEGGRP